MNVVKIWSFVIAQKEFLLSGTVNDPLRKKNFHCVKRITIAQIEFSLRKKNHLFISEILLHIAHIAYIAYHCANRIYPFKWIVTAGFNFLCRSLMWIWMVEKTTNSCVVLYLKDYLIAWISEFTHDLVFSIDLQMTQTSQIPRPRILWKGETFSLLY